MASIFTFEPEIPRVSSPWTKQLQDGDIASGSDNSGNISKTFNELPPDLAGLEPEPQEGPVEYKLHLLLRPRRNFSRIRTAPSIIEGKHIKHLSTLIKTESEPLIHEKYNLLAPLTVQARQHRLEQLTTQLLWRLQQSSPHHTSSASNTILPSLPEALPELQTPQQPAKLLHGLEESQGALYEIGVSDDGAFVGLAEDEMRESLNNLRAMAACMGCVVDIVRMVKVGEAEWIEDANDATQPSRSTKSKLLVAEALVKPYLSTGHMAEYTNPLDHTYQLDESGKHSLSQHHEPRENPTFQMRISLTGSTMSGKSSLLGTLSTSTLDNARGKSRLTMLKHRHEITSGITSSVSQELIGYGGTSDGNIDVVNYATSNISSWIDIHAATQAGRVVFLSDSAGHPRYRRTTVRGLVGWAPHWTFLCIPANDAEENTSTPYVSPKSGPTDTGMTLASDMDLSAAHLDLCLRLELPLVVVITKLDTASKTGLRVVLAKLLSSLKAAGRRPTIVPNTPGAIPDDEFQNMPLHRVANVQKCLASSDFDPLLSVPIVMTSALQGVGIESLHALMHGLPKPVFNHDVAKDVVDVSSPFFYIEDVYNKVADPQLSIIAGYLKQGELNVGDELYLGPCSTETEDSDDSDSQRQRRPSSIPQSRSFPGALRPAHFLARDADGGSEWRKVHIVSIRNLRLPTNTLSSDQVGTIGLRFVESDLHAHTVTPRLRKGMVLLQAAGKATINIVAEFRRDDLGSLAVGSHVVVYIASVRASARIISASIPPDVGVAAQTLHTSDMSDSISSLSSLSLGLEASKQVAGAVTHEFLHVMFHFESNREYIEVGSKILVMPGGGPGIFGGAERGEKGVAGLDGFVGRVVDIMT